jgi:GntR family transcriptional regulator/MocR family aminotransferase
MGVTLNLNRRMRLLEWAWETGAYIIEDDYDSDFRYTGSPLTALAGLDKHGCVFYMGTFSKSIGAGIRMGYLVVPRELIHPARTAKALMDNGHAWLDQATLADFISSGSFMRHLRRIRHSYLLRRDCLVEELHRHFGEVRLSGLEGGMHLIWHLPSTFPAANELQRIAENVGVGVYTLEAGAGFRYECNRCGEHALMLGYSSVPETMIREGIARLAKAISTNVG